MIHFNHFSLRKWYKRFSYLIGVKKILKGLGTRAHNGEVTFVDNHKKWTKLSRIFKTFVLKTHFSHHHCIRTDDLGSLFEINDSQINWRYHKCTNTLILSPSILDPFKTNFFHVIISLRKANLVNYLLQKTQPSIQLSTVLSSHLKDEYRKTGLFNHQRKKSQNHSVTLLDVKRWCINLSSLVVGLMTYDPNFLPTHCEQMDCGHVINFDRHGLYEM